MPASWRSAAITSRRSRRESGDRCTVTTKGGRKIKVYAAGSTLEDLRSWFKQGAKARSTVDRAEDALEATV